jgi:hypothetical protein
LQKITDIVHDTENPVWLDAFEVPYQFGKKEKYRILIFDVLDFDNPQALAL